MDKSLIETESWLSEYRIIEKRIDSLYKQAQRPMLREAFLKMGPKGDANMAVDMGRINVDGGHNPIPWVVNLESAYAKAKDISDDIASKIEACLAQQAMMLLAVDRAGLTQEEHLYIEQRYFEGMSVKEMEREGCRHTRLVDVKRSALEKIYSARTQTEQKVS